MSQTTDRIQARRSYDDPLHVVFFYNPENLQAIIDDLVNGRYTYVGYTKSHHGNCWKMMFNRQQKDYWGDTVDHTSRAIWEREDVNRVIHALGRAGIKKFKQIKQLKSTDLRKIEEELNQAVEAA